MTSIRLWYTHSHTHTYTLQFTFMILLLNVLQILLHFFMDIIPILLISTHVSVYTIIFCLRYPRFKPRKIALSRNEEYLEISCSQICTQLSKVIITGNHKSWKWSTANLENPLIPPPLPLSGSVIRIRGKCCHPCVVRVVVVDRAPWLSESWPLRMSGAATESDCQELPVPGPP